MTLYRHLSSLEADSQTDRRSRHILPNAIPGHQADSSDEDRVGADVELETAAERNEMVKALDVLLIPEIV